MLSILPLYLAIGGVAGILAGLLGIGGGLVIVPMLVACFGWQQGFPANSIMHLALGTSMASIVFTSVSSFLSHHKRGAVLWPVVRRITPGILVGTLGGTFLASSLPSRFLQGFFSIFLVYVGLQMVRNLRPEPSRQLPGLAVMFGAGGIIGVISSLVGIGGGTLSVPFMLWCNIGVHQAIGTSAAIGFPIAVAGTVGFIVNGLAGPPLPVHSLGYVYLPALVGLVAASVVTAPFGVRLAHRLPVPKLKRGFAYLLFATAGKMLWGVFF